MLQLNPDWIKALQLPAKVTGGLFVACTVIWFLDTNSTIRVDDLAFWLRPLYMIIWVVSGCLFGASMFADAWAAGVEYFKRRAETKDSASRKMAEVEAKEKQRQAIAAQLDHLSRPEIYEAAKALKAGSPSFESWAHSTGAGQLMSKGLIYSPQGTFNSEHFPFTFHDFAWEALQQRREAILEKEKAHELERKARR